MKTIKVLLVIALLSFLTFTVYADELRPLIYQYTNPEITVYFSEPLEVSAERQQEIANQIAGIPSNTFYSPGTNFPNNIICTLFGHDIAPEGTVTATHHKVNKYNPRCSMQVYHVTYCKRCDYAVAELDNEFLIVCCPED
jgi:hypothetical protein